MKISALILKVVGDIVHARGENGMELLAQN